MSDWKYLRVKITPDPILEQSKPQLYKEIDVDFLTWRSIVTNALGELYGLSGEARHFDILVKQSQKPALEAVVRIQEDDVDTFQTSLSNYSFSLSHFLGQEYGFGAYAKIVDHSSFLGVLADEMLVRRAN